MENYIKKALQPLMLSLFLFVAACGDDCSVGDIKLEGSCGDNGGKYIYVCEKRDHDEDSCMTVDIGGETYYENTNICSRCSKGETFEAVCEENPKLKQQMICIKGGEWVENGGCY